MHLSEELTNYSKIVNEYFFNQTEKMPPLKDVSKTRKKKKVKEGFLDKLDIFKEPVKVDNAVSNFVLSGQHNYTIIPMLKQEGFIATLGKIGVVLQKNGVKVWVLYDENVNKTKIRVAGEANLVNKVKDSIESATKMIELESALLSLKRKINESK